jgi:hypothetical protein
MGLTPRQTGRLGVGRSVHFLLTKRVIVENTRLVGAMG